MFLLETESLYSRVWAGNTAAVLGASRHYSNNSNNPERTF